MSAAAYVVVDLGFGDAGKGLVTDFLVRRHEAHTVVRFNGGAQAGHNVVTADGRHHTFAQLGAGTFVPGVRTHLAHGVVVHPTALLFEAAHLARAGVPDALARLSIDGGARVITPFHQAANRLRELSRGDARHGSCGVGVGEAVRDAMEAGDVALQMKHLLGQPAVLARRLSRVQERMRASLVDVRRAVVGVPEAQPELRLLDDPSVAEAWTEAVAPLLAQVRVTDEEFLSDRLTSRGAVVFEGAQGVLLDEWYGFHPHTTWSTCTFAPALALLDAHGFDGARIRVGVLRTYVTRHGAGPLPTEDDTLAPLLPEPHNGHGPWQGRFRRGWPDLVLWRYALEACGGADALAVTHLDALERFRVWRVCSAYRLRGDIVPSEGFDLTADGRLRRLRAATVPDLGYQAGLTRTLARSEPHYEALPRATPDTYPGFLADALGVPLALGSMGPRAQDVRELGPMRAHG